MSKNGLRIVTPTSIASTGTSATISANGSVSFTAVTSLSLNGVFTADYDNYMVVLRTNSSGSCSIETRLRVGGVDNSTASSYTSQTLTADSTTVSGGRASAAQFDLLNVYAVQRAGAIVYFFAPFLAQPTAIRTVEAGDYLSASLRNNVVTHNQSTSYDGFSLLPNATRNITGLVAVYGLRT